MATFSVSYDMETKAHGYPYQQCNCTATYTYDSTVNYDNSVTYHITRVDVNWNCYVKQAPIKPLVRCEVCCGTWSWKIGDPFGGDVAKSAAFGVQGFPNTSSNYSKALNYSFTLAPGASKSFNTLTVVPGGTGCTIAKRSTTLTNPYSEPTPTPPTLNVSCSPSTVSATVGSFSASGNYGYCDNPSNSTKYWLYSNENLTGLVASGSGNSASFSGLSPNSTYYVNVIRGNGCFTREKTCSFTTLTPNTLSDAQATSFDSGCVRVAVTYGGQVYEPTTTVKVRKCKTSTWKTVGTTDTTTVDTVCFDGLEEETCYEVQACTTTTAGTYCSDILTFTTPKKCVQGTITSTDVVLDEKTWAVEATVCVHWETYSAPATLGVQYRVKGGFDEEWQESELLEIEGPVGEDGKLEGDHCFVLSTLFPNLVEYEMRLHGKTEDGTCDLVTEPTTFITPLVPEPDPVKICETMTYLSELICQSVKKLYDGNKTIYANPTSAELCDPYSENPTQLTLWSRLLRFFHAMNCVLCSMEGLDLNAGKEGQYYVGEIGWVDMLDKVLSDADSQSWRLVTSEAIKAYIDAKLHEVWHYHRAVDYMVGTLDERDKLPEDATSCLVADENKVYIKDGGAWVEAPAADQPDNFGAYHINYAYKSSFGDVPAESAYYYFEGTWNRLDGAFDGIIEQLKLLEEQAKNVVISDSDKKVQVVDENFDFNNDGEEGVIYFVTETEKPEIGYHTVTFDTAGHGKCQPQPQQIPDGAYAQKPTDPTDDKCEFEEWEEDKSFLVLTALTAGTARFNNKWQGEVLIDKEPVAANTGYIEKTVQAGQKIKYSLADDADASTPYKWASSGNYNRSIVESADGATFEVTTTNMEAFRSSTGSSGSYAFYAFCSGKNNGAVVSAAEGTFDTSVFTTISPYFFSHFNYYGKLASLPAGSFNISNIVSNAGGRFEYFNCHGALQSLPNGSFRLNEGQVALKGNLDYQYFNQYGALESLPEGSFNLDNVTELGGDTFVGFNNEGELKSLPEGSFNISNVAKVGRYSFMSFNMYGKLTSLPEGSFDTSNIESVGYDFFSYFNSFGALVSLPEGSFRFDSLENANLMFDSFNWGGALQSLPEGSFRFPKLTAIDSSGFGSFYSFNRETKNSVYDTKLEVLPDGAFTFPLVTSMSGFMSFNESGSLKSLGEGSFQFPAAISVGASFCQNFNASGLLESLPEGSFDLSNVTYLGYQAFRRFNNSGKNMTKLPANSFNTSNVASLSTEAFWGFNQNGGLTSLPSGSFNFDNVTSLSREALGYFNYAGNLTGLPSGSFGFANLTSDNATATDYFKYFNAGGGKLTKGNEGVSFTALHDITGFNVSGQNNVTAGTTVYVNADES